MSWVTIIWAMVASECLTLAVMQLIVWFTKRTAWANLLLALWAVATAAMAGGELWLMRAETPGQFATAVRWLHVPAWVFVVAMAGFVLLYLRAGRPWLAWAICALRTLSLAVNFLVGQNLNYLEVIRLRRIPFLGESVSVAEGVSNPWMLVGQLSLLLLVVFVADATITVWRRGDRRLALISGGGILFCVLIGAVLAVLELWGIVRWPLTASLSSMAIVTAMAYEMSRDTLRAARLADDLRETEQRMALAAEVAGFGVWMWSVAHDQVWGSDRWLRLFGFAPDAAVTFQKFIQRIHPDDRENVESGVRHAMDAASDYAGEYRVMLPEGTERWIAARGRMYLDPDRRPARMVGAAIDITQRKQNEGEMTQLRLELAHLARVLTMNETSASLAHEINQPLGAILNNATAAKLLLSRVKEGNDDISDILADIIQDAKRAGDVVRKIRGIVKKGAVEYQPVNMNALIKDVMELFQTSINLNRISLRSDLQPDLVNVRGDRVHLQQVLLNLITNSLEAMKGRSPGTLTIRSIMASPDLVTVSVSDSGTGIDPDHVFKPFYTTKKDGLGMGLCICRSIIKEHGGRIWAENNPTGGAAFSFELPAWRGESA
jgi:two-component system, LuxR family, sensor kinase FixL